MAITINGTANTVAGLAVGGLPDGVVDNDSLANTTITAAKIAADTITASQIAADTITASQIAANAVGDSELNAATGKILQVVGNLNTGGGTCSTSTDWTETYITDTITPTTTGSKIAVFATGMGGYIAGTGHANMTIGRNVNSEGWSYLGDTTNGMAYIYGSTTHYTAAFSYLDSPTYTSGESIEYSIFMKVGGGTVSAHCIGNGNSYSPIILMEVAA